MDSIRDAIKIAKEIVKDEEEPYKIEAFKIILANLLKNINIERKVSMQELIPKIGSLTNKEKIQIILYYADRPLTREEIKAKSLELGIDEGWWQGSNFRRDLMKRNKLVIEERDDQGNMRYKLTEIAKVMTSKLIESLH